jgi:signal transduction histidine kinase
MRLGRPPTSQVAAADLGRCIQEAISMLRDTGPLKRASVVVEVPPETVRVAIGETPLEQVLLNLIKNAADAVKDVRDHLPTIRVAATADHVAGTASCAITDDGVGIPPERMTLLFEPYHTTKEPGKGTGLGLFVVRHIVDSVGGRITAESRPGQGSTFTFTVPLVKDGASA